MGANGQTILDLGPYPGVSDAEFTITGLSGIADASRVDAWVLPASTTAGFQADGVAFNGVIGSPNYLQRAALAGVADSPLGVFSAWIKTSFNKPGASRFILYGLISGFTNILYVQLDEFVSTRPGFSLFAFDIATTTLASFFGQQQLEQRWFHLLASWDTNSQIGSFYIDDVLRDATTGGASASIPYSLADQWNVSDPLSDFTAVIGELYFAPGQYLDLSVVGNRRKFISAAGQAVSLGTDGSLPTGTVPAVYLHLDRDEAPQNFSINRGSGGDFSWGNLAAVGGGVPLVTQPAHSIDEHACDAPAVRAYSPSAAGASMLVRLSARRSPFQQGPISGKWNVAWAWD